MTIADEMFEKTDSENAPWVLISGNDKYYARIQILKETLAHIEKQAQRRGLEIPSLFEREERKAIAELELAVKEAAAGLAEEVEDIKEVKGIMSVRKTKLKNKSKKRRK